MPEFILALPPPLASQALAPALLAGSQRDIAAYRRFCDNLQTATD